MRAADPRRIALDDAHVLLTLARGRGARRWLIAVGKAAAAMAEGAEAISRESAAFGGGIVVAATPAPPIASDIEFLIGDHPVPGEASLTAAARLGELVARGREGDAVLVLISGGASSLIAAPVDRIEQDDLARLYELLLGSGLGIDEMNAVRKRFLRFGAGRLRAALRGAIVRAVALSDVMSDDVATVGSGPCEPDRWTAPEVVTLLRNAGLWARVPHRLRTYLEAVARGELPETPKPDDPLFAGAPPTTLHGNQHALFVAREHARRHGMRVPEQRSHRLSGSAEGAGILIASELLWLHREGASATALLWGGETTVRLGDSPGRGGRCQHLALAAARRLDRAGVGDAITLLAAGTDGRDGPTDAAGAIVDGTTWRRVREAGIDPERALAARDSYPALDAVGALLRTGPTGTNVADVMVGLVR